MTYHQCSVSVYLSREPRLSFSYNFTFILKFWNMALPKKGSYCSLLYITVHLNYIWQFIIMWCNWWFFFFSSVRCRFFVNIETLVSYVFSGPTSPLAFSESVLVVLNQGAKLVENKERLWRMWSILINPLTEKVNQVKSLVLILLSVG